MEQLADGIKNKEIELLDLSESQVKRLLNTKDFYSLIVTRDLITRKEERRLLLNKNSLLKTDISVYNDDYFKSRHMFPENELEVYIDDELFYSLEEMFLCKWNKNDFIKEISTSPDYTSWRLKAMLR